MPEKIRNTYQEITDQVLAQLEVGVRPWIREWREDVAGVSAIPLRSNGAQYRGINTIMLWLARQTIGYAGNTWLTFKQAMEQGGHVRRGESGHLVVKYGTFAPKGSDEERHIPFLKGYTVFNVDQIEGLPDAFYPQPAPTEPGPAVPAIETVDAFVAATGVRVSFSGKRACYRPGFDDILMPDRNRFTDPVYLYSTLLHELAHWSGGEMRLNRDMKNRFGDKAYAAEELVAEMATAFLCADLGVPHDPKGNTATYVEGWLQVLHNDSRAIFTAAAKAQQAADYLRGPQPLMTKSAA